MPASRRRCPLRHCRPAAATRSSSWRIEKRRVRRLPPAVATSRCLRSRCHPRSCAVELMGMLILAAVVGLCIGSFLNVVIHRLPRMLEQRLADTVRRAFRRDLATARRATTFSYRDRNVPRAAIVSARSRTSPSSATCSCAGIASPAMRRSRPRYPIVELITAALTVRGDRAFRSDAGRYRGKRVPVDAGGA